MAVDGADLMDEEYQVRECKYGSGHRRNDGKSSRFENVHLCIILVYVCSYVLNH